LNSQIKIGTLLLDTTTNRLIYGKEQQQIEPKLVAVIRHLVEHKNEVVTRDDLAKAVWQEQVVSDNAVNRSISQVRKLLAQSESPQPRIETIPRVGYRLFMEEIESIAEINNEIVGVNTRTKRNDSKQSNFDWGTLKVIVFIAFSLALFGRYFYQLFFLEKEPTRFSQITLTQSSGVEKLAKFSADGMSIAYVAAEKDTGNEHIFVRELNSNKTTQVTHEPAYIVDLAWSPDSNYLIYSRWNDIHDRRCEINLISLNVDRSATKKQKILGCSERAAVHFAWNQDSNKFYFNYRESFDRPYSVKSYSILSKRFEQITLPPQSGNYRGDYYISGNLSGSRIAVVRYLGTNSIRADIYRTSDNKLIFSEPLQGNVSDLTWLGQDILLLSKNNNLFRFDFKNNEENFYYSIGKNSGGINTDYDGQRILFTVSESDINLVEFSLDGRKPEKLLAESTATEVLPARSHSKQTMAFLSNRTGLYQIWIRDSDGEVSQLSESPVSLGLSPLHWSPDDRSILFQFDDEIFLIDVQTGVIKRMIDRSHKTAVANWSYDGRSVFYSSEKSGEWQIWQFQLATKTHNQITRLGGYSARQAASGDLYFSRIHEPGLWKIKGASLSSNQLQSAELVLSQFDATNWLSWQLADGNIYYFGELTTSDSSRSKTGIMAFNINNKMRELLFPFDSNHIRYFDVQDNSVVVAVKTRSEGSIQLLSPSDE